MCVCLISNWRTLFTREKLIATSLTSTVHIVRFQHCIVYQTYWLKHSFNLIIIIEFIGLTSANRRVTQNQHTHAACHTAIHHWTQPIRKFIWCLGHGLSLFVLRVTITANTLDSILHYNGRSSTSLILLCSLFSLIRLMRFWALRFSELFLANCFKIKRAWRVTNCSYPVNKYIVKKWMRTSSVFSLLFAVSPWLMLFSYVHVFGVICCA